MSDLADELLARCAAASLVLAAERGLITELACAMPKCRCPRGRTHFEPKHRLNKWGPSADRWPVPGREGGSYTADNVRLAHLQCNRVEGSGSPRPSLRGKTGRKMSAETKAKLSASKMGHTVSIEARAKMSSAHKGVPWTPAQHAARDGTTWSPARRAAFEAKRVAQTGERK